MELIGFFVAVAAFIGLALLWKKMSSDNQLREKMQQEVAGEITEKIVALDSYLKANAQNLNAQVANVQQELGVRFVSEFATLNKTTRDELSSMRFELHQVQDATTKNLTEITGQIGARLDGAAKVINDVKTNLGSLSQATLEIKEVGASVAKLDEILRAPKLRGGMGEAILGDMLKQVLPADNFVLQYRMPSTSEVADAIVKTSTGIVAIDSKFPLENFRKATEAQNDEMRSAALKSFYRDVKNRGDEIASKYIVPADGTFDFALMFIPAENVFATAMQDHATCEYLASKKVFPVSPMSIYVYLQTILIGLRALRVEENAQKILNGLQSMSNDFTKLDEYVGKVVKQATFARDNATELVPIVSQITARVKAMVQQ